MNETLEQRIERLENWRKELDELNVEDLVGTEQSEPPLDEFDFAWAQHRPLECEDPSLVRLESLREGLRKAFRTAIANERKSSELLRSKIAVVTNESDRRGKLLDGQAESLLELDARMEKAMAILRGDQ